VDLVHFTEERWLWWVAHPELHDVVDPVELLREKRNARLSAATNDR
jgi:hypothetical protein